MPNFNKTRGFSLKSGNNPAFKMMAGESPITSPYNQLANPDDLVKMTKAKTGEEAQRISDASLKPNEQGPELKDGKAGKMGKMGKGGKKGAGLGGIFVGALTGGLDAVYGSGKVLPPASARLIKKKKKKSDDKKSEMGSKTSREILGMNSSSVTNP